MFIYTLSNPRFCGNLGCHSQKLALGTSLPEFIPEKVYLFVADLFRGRHGSTKVNEKSNYSQKNGA
jgi:hypothetical protein